MVKAKFEDIPVCKECRKRHSRLKKCWMFEKSKTVDEDPRETCSHNDFIFKKVLVNGINGSFVEGVETFCARCKAWLMLDDAFNSMNKRSRDMANG